MTRLMPPQMTFAMCAPCQYGSCVVARPTAPVTVVASAQTPSAPSAMLFVVGGRHCRSGSAVDSERASASASMRPLVEPEIRPDGKMIRRVAGADARTGRLYLERVVDE